MSARVAITGAASGIGAAAADALRAAGAQVVGLDLNAREDWIVVCDVRDQASVDRAVAAAIERLGGGLDVLINNAGIGNPQSSGSRPDAAALAVVDVNLLGPWRVTAAALPALREARGRVVNVASGLSFVTFPFATAYCMSKRGLVAYSDSLRLEHGDAITVTTVYPGYVRTPIHETSRAVGVGLEGAVPAEPVEHAARVLVRAALGPPVRDLPTTRSVAVVHALARHAPRALLDRVARGRLRRLAASGHFDRSEMTREFGGRLRSQLRSRARLDSAG